MLVVVVVILVEHFYFFRPMVQRLNNVLLAGD